MSSAILYLAIIAIWAGVLIPRWLKRDTSQAKKSKALRGLRAEADAREAGVPMADDAGRAGAAGELDGDGAEDGLGEYEAGVPMAYQRADPEARRRILTARRRMLMMLVALAAVALGIVAVGMAAWWVALPPALMVGGYLLLLRETRRADAERAQVLADAAAYREEEDRRRAEREAAEKSLQGAARRAEPRTARIIDISERVRDEFYDQYADAERRAVGD